jgi:glycosyltransferase involved in cell wall biosynthesis
MEENPELSRQSAPVTAILPTQGVSLLTGGWDKPYALGLTEALVSQGVAVDFLGTEEVDAPELHDNPRIHFVSLQRAPRLGGGLADKAVRTFSYYWRTLRYAATARPKVFHILWNNKFLLFDRTVLLLLYKLLGKRLVFTAHNVNAGKRDGNDNWLNRLTLKIQYHLVDHVFVHTPQMKRELAADFRVPPTKISVIPFGINNTVPDTELTRAQARKKLGLGDGEKVMLFFGHIVPYKGLEYLVSAFTEIACHGPDSEARLVIAGKPKLGTKECETWWNGITTQIARCGVRDRILERFEHVPDEQVELFFKAADVLVLPYTHIFQSGVLFLAYRFGLPVVATDVGSLRQEIVEGKTGFVCRARDARDLAKTLVAYFESALFKELEKRRQEIRAYAERRHSWSEVSQITTEVYSALWRR